MYFYDKINCSYDEKRYKNEKENNGNRCLEEEKIRCPEV